MLIFNCAGLVVGFIQDEVVQRGGSRFDRGAMEEGGTEAADVLVMFSLQFVRQKLEDLVLFGHV